MSAAVCLDVLTSMPKGATPGPEEVIFESLGTVLVLGDDAGVGDAAEIVARSHRTVVFAPGIETRAFASHVTAVSRRVVAVSGHMGAFRAAVGDASGVTDIGAASPNPDRCFDLVLDLCREPIWRSELKPLGYFAPGNAVIARAAAIEAIDTLVGRFTKPGYLVFQPELCAHGASGLKGCTRCLEACPGQAIASGGNTIGVDPYLCQGCAACALACPTGALSVKSPSREALGHRLEQVLSSDGTAGATLIAHSSRLSEKIQSIIHQHKALSLVVDPPCAFGDELWLRALALGAGKLVLVADPMLLAKSRQAITSSVEWMHTMLLTLGIARDRLTLLEESALPAWLDQQRDAMEPAGTDLTASRNRLASYRSATTHWAKYKRLAWVDDLRLLDAATCAGVSAALPARASFGEVWVQTQRCTLCFACVNLCPTGALNAVSGKTQQLRFQESACIQCGLCAKVCPEKAISLHARFAPQALARMTSTALQQDEQVLCASCGNPFISRRMLASVMGRVQCHPVVNKSAHETLLICPSCRQREMLAVG